jgi:hypothetical protein
VLVGREGCPEEGDEMGGLAPRLEGEAADGMVNDVNIPCDVLVGRSMEVLRVSAASIALNRKGVVDVIDETSINALASLWAAKVSSDVGKEMLKGKVDVS